MVSANPITQLSGLARRLMADGLLDEQTAQSATQAALKERIPFPQYVVEQRLASAGAVAWSACQEFGAPLFDLAVMDLEAAPVKLVDEKLIRQHQALPLYKRGNRLYVAVADPTNLQALDEIAGAHEQHAPSILDAPRTRKDRWPGGVGHTSSG